MDPHCGVSRTVFGMGCDKKECLRLAKIARFAALAKENEFRKSKLYFERRRSDYAWRMLLELYIARANGYRLLATRLWAEAGMNPTTGGRWLDYLADEGYVVKTEAPGHNRAVYVEMTESAISMLEDHLLTVFGKAAEIAKGNATSGK